MAFFFDDKSRTIRARRTKSLRVGWTLVLVAVLGIAGMAWVPSPYVVQQPGSTFDTLGTVAISGKEVEMIEIPAEKVYPTKGSLTLLTVGVVGSRRTPVPWLDIVRAWFDPSKAVIPVDVAYPMGQTVEQSNEENQLLMTESQQAATAAALIELGHDVPTVLTVRAVVPGSPADGHVEVGDQIVKANGQALKDASGLQETVRKNGTSPVELTVVRDGTTRTLSLTPASGFANKPIIGVSVETSYDFPFQVHIQLQDVGGPSAGMMFALGIIDKLTPGAMTGGADIAGTGTVTAGGTVGPIGGIRQKLYGASYSGAKWFLAPESNCNEVVGHIPDGLTVFAVDTLKDAVNAVEAIKSGDTAKIPTCKTG